MVWVKDCIWVMSLVILVISAPVENLSIFEKENFCILAKTSFLKSAARREAPFMANQLPAIPAQSMISDIPAILSPAWII